MSIWKLLSGIFVLLVSQGTTLARIVEHNHSEVSRPTGYDYIKNIKAAIEYDLKDKRVVKCYQCVYSPPRLETKLVARRKTGGETELFNVTKEVHGGWEPCKGPFTKTEARTYGIDAGHCLSNCYTRLDHLGILERGCYRGEYGVNPNMTGCHQQAGYIYCFCEGDRCNRHLPTEAIRSQEEEPPLDVTRLRKTYSEPYDRDQHHHRDRENSNDRGIASKPEKYLYKTEQRPEQRSTHDNVFSNQQRESSIYVPFQEKHRNRHDLPKMKEYHDKNSYYLRSQYEKEVNQNNSPATRYHSLAEFGREVPSSVNTGEKDSSQEVSEPKAESVDTNIRNSFYSKDKDTDTDRYEDWRYKWDKDNYYKRQEKDKNVKEKYDKDRYRSSYHSYGSELGDQYKPRQYQDEKKGISTSSYGTEVDRRDVMTGDKEGWREQLAMPHTTTQNPRQASPSRQLVIMTRENNDQRQSHKTNDDSASLFLKQSKDADADKQQTDKRKGKQGFYYDQRWFF